MGMEFRLDQISPKQLENFIKRPRRAYEYVLSHEFEGAEVTKFLSMLGAYTQAIPPDVRANRDRLAGTLPFRRPQENGGNLQLLRKYIDRREKKRRTVKRRSFILGKVWHVLHFILSGRGEAGPGVASAILGGTELPDLDGVMGYGPIQYLRPTEVKSIAIALAKVTEKETQSRFNRQEAEAKRIYLASTVSAPEDWEYVQSLLEGLKAFYIDAQTRGSAMLKVIY